MSRVGWKGMIRDREDHPRAKLDEHVVAKARLLKWIRTEMLRVTNLKPVAHDAGVAVDTLRDAARGETWGDTSTLNFDPWALRLDLWQTLGQMGFDPDDAITLADILVPAFLKDVGWIPVCGRQEEC